jgi:hypothetical protein
MTLPDTEATLRCRIEDLRRNLRDVLIFWEMDLNSADEDELTQEQRESSRAIIKEAREEHKLASDWRTVR